MSGEVLDRAAAEIRSVNGIGMGVMEISHRSRHFARILEKAELGLRELMNIPDSYRVLFLQGGATLQFSMVPMNLATNSEPEYITTGYWGKRALEAAFLSCDPKEIFSGEVDGFCSVPEQGEIVAGKDADYVYYTSNETIEGVEFKYELDAGSVPVVCDMSSNILSKPVDVSNFGLIYAGAQKNIGPSGVTVVIVRNDLLERSPSDIPPLLNYRELSANDSMVNTPNTWGIYLIGLVCDWLREQGGVAAMEVRNRAKAAALYDAIDSSDGYYTGHAVRKDRSIMNVTFRLPSSELDKKFCTEAEAAGLDGLAGHRSLGGVRASIYNAFPPEGVNALVEFMGDFAAQNS